MRRPLQSDSSNQAYQAMGAEWAGGLVGLQGNQCPDSIYFVGLLFLMAAQTLMRRPEPMRSPTTENGYFWMPTQPW